MSIEQTPPNLDHTPDNEAVEDRISDDRISDDIDRIHALCEILEPSFEQIEAGVPIEDESLRDKFTELTVLLAELHPADVAAVLESLPPRERNIVWLLVAPEDDGEVLLEVSDAVRETLIESIYPKPARRSRARVSLFKWTKPNSKMPSCGTVIICCAPTWSPKIPRSCGTVTCSSRKSKRRSNA